MRKLSPPSTMEIQAPRHKIAKFTFRGVEYDCTKKNYEIDDNHNVYSDGKLLATSKDNNIGLMVGGKEEKFGVPRLYQAVVNSIDDLEIEKYSGIKIVDHDLDTSDAGKYAYETPSDRDELRARLQKKIQGMRDIWKTVMHDGVAYELYEIFNKTGKVRNKKNKKERSATGGRVTLQVGDGKKVSILVHRAYMCTFFGDQRRPDQIEVDHINGDNNDNSPWNLRWASRSENEMYKFTPMAKQMRGVPFTGKITDHELIEFEGWYFGYVFGRYAVLNPVKDGYMIRFVGDFRLCPYPTIMVNNKSYYVHRLVAFLHEMISAEQLSAPSRNEVVKHADHKKYNFDPKNLSLGTGSENQRERHENPETTGRKRVRSTTDDGTEKEYDSMVAAARAVAGDASRLGEAIKGGKKYKKMCWKLA